MCEQCHKMMGHMETILDDLQKHVAAQNTFLQNVQRAQIPKFLTQARQYISANTTLNFSSHSQAQNLLRVTTIIIQVGSPADLVINERSWPVNGFTVLYLGPDGIFIRPEDTITLTQTTASPMGLEMLGVEMVDRGMRW